MKARKSSLLTLLAIVHGDVGILDHTYKVCTYVDDMLFDHILLVRQHYDKLIKFTIINSNATNPDIRSIYQTTPK